MRSTKWILAEIAALAGLLTLEGMGQTTVIPSFQENGRVSWTNAANSNALYRVEWALQAAGPWHAFTYQPLRDALSATAFAAEVPLFYRVVMATNEPPPGMVWIDGGDVELGQAGIAEPVHTNFVSGFWMDEMEVTKALWDVVAVWALTNGYDITVTNGLGKAINHPVQTVTWYEAVKWCNARSQMEGLDPCYFTSAEQSAIYTKGTVDVPTNGVDWSANGYRLPTEAEWEKAARGGRQGRLFPWGDTIQHARANYCSRTNEVYDTSSTRGYHPAYTNDGVEPYTSPAGSFPANGYGLHDMAGNVWEWCWDWFGDYQENDQTDPKGLETGTDRVLRGGSLGNNASFTRCAFRSSTSPATEAAFYGFRCAREP